MPKTITRRLSACFDGEVNPRRTAKDEESSKEQTSLAICQITGQYNMVPQLVPPHRRLFLGYKSATTMCEWAQSWRLFFPRVD